MSEPRPEHVAGVLLAGGQSRRMGGGDKGLRLLGGKPMMEHVRDRLARQASPIVLNANGDPARFAGLGLDVVADAGEAHAGPLAGVLAGLIWAKANAPQARYIVTAACDTPFFPETLVASLLAATGDAYPAIALAASGGQVHPVFGLWPVALADDLDAALRSGTRKVLDWAGKHEMFIVSFPRIEADGREIDPFFNANTPEDLATAQDWLAQGARA
jgi:molybdopterin-guanine dinucleotide biosynthesis protein A